MTIDIEKIKKLREETGAGVMDAKKALEETGGDYAKSVKILMEKGLAKAEKRADRAAGQGLVFCYIHSGAKVGSLLMLACETDFVAKTEEFQKLGKEIAMQVATEEYASTDDLLDAEYVRDAGMKVKDLLAETVAKLGEKIEIRAFTRYSI
ncbi:TPA: translation elongation factor Ts [candidate division WWE3 bacterium]|uniref:Elongation factor Ts n=4 Tax=Katanobacteria TaxID=422282 RepID=A0A0G1HDH1_UNCKA|nr:MAG: Elongation factor Ts [candidate division WWE3 bacterium GW2011_GWA2_44_16]KKT68911.1 MAG: Elongation factor Ts [candidate division WWE3 bacterium GW2011_GWB1_44_4]OGC52824.1 MAG: translation elongation factor Ts [candidate division WWE3 bacterium RIFCSPHIGHO2_01_FULL_43_9]HAZ29373.1 translation elongation factor Ts [candidate division WWE3 bacterium]